MVCALIVYQVIENRIDLENENAEYGEFILNFNFERVSFVVIPNIHHSVSIKHGEKMDSYICYLIFMHFSDVIQKRHLFYDVLYSMKL